MRKPVTNSIVLVILLAVMIVSLAFSGSGLSRVKCSSVNVVINEDSPRFLDEKEIEKIILKNNEKLFEKKLSVVNTDVIEEKLEKVASIKKAEVFRKISGTELDFKGQLIVEVEQRRPIVRIIAGNKDYYLDGEGVKIPRNDKFTAKVVVVNGNVPDKYAQEKLLPFVKFIDENEFWKAMIGQIYVRQNEELILVPQIGDQLIEFGEADQVREKFRNLKALYQQVFADTGWEKYRRINLKYENQVVCTKK